MASSSDISFPQLPTHIVEIILGYLNFREVCAMRGLCRRLMETCGRIVRKGMRHLKHDIYNELVILQQELISSDPDNVLLRVPLLRCYYVMEILRSEHRLLCALCRRVLTREDQCFPGGHLIDEYYEVLQKVRSRVLPAWNRDTDVTNHLLHITKTFLEGFTAEEFALGLGPRLGVRVVDLLDALIAADYNLTVTYDRLLRTCNLVGEYELSDTKFLSLPPEILSTLEGHFITPEEAHEIIVYLTTIVRFNNRLCLREEQYWREMEATRRAQQDLQQRGLPRRLWRMWPSPVSGYALSPAPRVGIISLAPRDYTMYRLCRERKVISEHVIKETYREHIGRKCPFRGFWCRINLTCSLDDAPLELMDNWKRLSFRIMTGRELGCINSSEDMSVKIRAFLELPQINNEYRRKFTNVDHEEEVEVHFPTTESSGKISNSGTLELKPINSSLMAETNSQYNTFVEIRVRLPVRGVETEICKVCFRDGEQQRGEGQVGMETEQEQYSELI